MNRLIVLISCLLVGMSCQNTSLGDRSSVGVARFEHIDKQLRRVANLVGTELAISGGGHSFDNTIVPENKLEMRGISWIDGAIGKGIFIRQNFENQNIDAPDWDFTITAWLADRESKDTRRPYFRKDLLKKVKFTQIEDNIDHLLKDSLENLASVKQSDLGYN